MEGCKNKEHKQPCQGDNRCIFCGLHTCSPNYVNHICTMSWYEEWQQRLPILRKQFEKHELRVMESYNDGKGEYRFSEKDRWVYSMYIIFRPNTIIVFGDIRPSIILMQRDIDFDWLKKAVHDPRYLMEKDITDHSPEREIQECFYLVAGLQMFCEVVEQSPQIKPGGESPG